MWNKKECRIFVKRQLKRIIEYKIINDCKVFHLKGTPITVKYSLRKKFKRKWQNIPIKPNKIVFDNYMGSGYGCNGKYVTETLLKNIEKYEIVWIVKDANKKRNLFPKQVEVIEYLSPEAFEAYASAKVWVCNYHMVPYLNKGLFKKDNQIYIQMWHGSFGIKKIEGDSPVLARDQNWIWLAKKNSEITDYWISNSSFETLVYKKAFWNPSNILEYGHPRNDLFFHLTKAVEKKVKTQLTIESDANIVLYVPTYRDEKKYSIEPLNINMLIDNLERKFGGDWEMVLRFHPRMEKNVESLLVENGKFVDATEYSDIQELLGAAAIVLTDYSSCIFDFLLTGRPGFLYVPDRDYYTEIRGLYYPLEDTPFPVSANNMELGSQILHFDENKYKERIIHFLLKKGSVEDGSAACRVANLINSVVNEK